MGDCLDFLVLLHPDTSIKILSCLDDIVDIVRVSSVSRQWQQLVIENGLAKRLCLRSFPQLCKVASIVEINDSESKGCEEVTQGCSSDLELMRRDHRVFVFLAFSISSSLSKNCVTEVICASSTDSFPNERIDHTLEPRDVVAGRPSYWSSYGHSNPDEPETLIYGLASDFCIVTEINIRPFQAFFQPGSPVYSAKSVRFHLGRIKSAMDVRSNPVDDSNSSFIWTYTSPEFSMAQENLLQNFKLPEPVLCIGGILKIDLLGRVQTQEMDALFYICISHVQVFGQTLYPAFDVEVVEPSGEFVLKCNHKAETNNQLSTLESTIHPFYVATSCRHHQQLRQIVRMLGGKDILGEDYGLFDDLFD